MAAKGARFVEVPADRLMEELSVIGLSVEEIGGRYVRRREGREVVVDVVPPGGRAMVTVYTSLAEGALELRDCGEDAVRILVTVELPEGVRPLEDGQKVLRTAPRDAKDRVGTFLERLRGEVREAYKRALHVPTCPSCASPMAVRHPKDEPKRKFYGCIRFPTCRGTRPMPKEQ
jgi:hypothetical protein